MPYLALFLIVFILLVSIGLKWQINRKILIAWTLFMAIVGCTTVFWLSRLFPDSSAWLGVFVGACQAVVITIVVVLLRFYRDPERTPPLLERTIVSPADGTIVYIKDVKAGTFPFSVKGRNTIPLKEFIGTDFLESGGVQIGIGMNLLNVHVNRAPIKGKITMVKRIEGQFLSLKNINALLENERVSTIIDGEQIKVAVIQIASRLVRRIISYLPEGTQVEEAQRIGMIRFGSQVDLLIPHRVALKIVAKINGQVKAGVSILANY
jgi:phosphatidylserine decarboxylase